MYEKIDQKVEQIIKEAKKYMNSLEPSYVHDEIWKAYIYARDAHEGQFRHSGDPYIIHPVDATKILLDIKPDISTLQACLLHDVIEDTPRNEEDIKESFGEEVAFLCHGLEKLSKLKYKGQQRDIGSLRKMFVAMADDVRVIFIKLADRTHNMRTLKYHPKKEKREKIALETLNIFSPIADRLGLYQFKNNLDEECFKILDKKAYLKLKRELKQIDIDSKEFFINAKIAIKLLLKEQKIKKYTIDMRIKSIYSIYKKIQKKGLEKASDLYDIFGIRIIVETEADCYKALGLIHKNWTPLPKRFKDYIALPKPNGYKSIHTNIIGLLKKFRKQPTEIQIKTYAMKEFSDIGVAAHFEYKEKGSKIATDIDWVKELKELTNSIQDNDFVGSLKVDLFKDRIFVFTPKGGLINLPAGATSVDFAYYVHTDLGDHLTLARVNNSVYPLDKELHNGDVVEIVIDKNKKPNPFWISFVKTLKAKNRIKSFLKKEDKELHTERGKEMLNRYLEKSGLDALDKDMSILKILDGASYTKEERGNILEQIGNFSMTPSNVMRRIFKQEKIQIKNNHKKNSESSTPKEDKNIHKKILIIGGESGLDYKLCHCSRRKISNDIVAHINGKGVITVHRRNCKVLENVNTQRLLSAYVEGNQEELLEVPMKMVFNNRIGILKDLSEIIYAMDMDIHEILSKKISKSRHGIELVLTISDYDYLIIDRFIERIQFHFKKELVKVSLTETKKSK